MNGGVLHFQLLFFFSHPKNTIQNTGGEVLFCFLNTMHATRTLLIKKRRGYFELLRHRLMYKIYANFNAWGPEGRITFESNQDMWLNRLDAIEGENAASQQITAESDQFNADYAANAYAHKNSTPFCK